MLARLVFIDETAVSTNLVRLKGRGPRGERVIGSVPLGSWQTITFVAALRHNKMTAPMVVEGAMTGEMFLAYVEQCLVPTLKRNDVHVLSPPKQRYVGRRCLPAAAMGACSNANTSFTRCRASAPAPASA